MIKITHSNVSRMADNIMCVYLDADPLTRQAGCRWYGMEQTRCREMAADWGLPVTAVAGAAAAISPGMRWSFVYSYLAALRANPLTKVPTYSHLFVRRALRCLLGEHPDSVIRGPKTTAFWHLLAFPAARDVVVDAHAQNIAVGTWRPTGIREKQGERLTPKRYEIVADAYRLAAYWADIPPQQMQAVTWLHWRNLHGRRA